MPRNSVKLFYFCLMFSLCSFFTMPTMAESSNLAGYWNFDDNILDHSGNGNNGTTTGTTAYDSGKVGKAFDFDGSTYIECSSNPSLSITDNISIEFWFYPKKWVTGTAAQPIHKWTGTKDANYVMYFFGNTIVNSIGFYANAGGTWQVVSPHYQLPSLNTWYHIVWTYNSATGGKLYVNGNLYGSPTGSGTLATNTAKLTLGKFLTEPSFNGLIDELKIYNRVLTAEEVQQNSQNVLTK